MSTSSVFPPQLPLLCVYVCPQQSRQAFCVHTQLHMHTQRDAEVFFSRFPTVVHVASNSHSRPVHYVDHHMFLPVHMVLPAAFASLGELILSFTLSSQHLITHCSDRASVRCSAVPGHGCPPTNTANCVRTQPEATNKVLIS